MSRECKALKSIGKHDPKATLWKNNSSLSILPLRKILNSLVRS
jgi:hypothetical protein